MAGLGKLDSQLLAEEGSGAHTSSAVSTAPTGPSSAAASDRGLLGSSELYDWLHFWSTRRDSKAEDAFDNAFSNAKLRHKHWTPDRGPGRLAWHAVSYTL